jgi:uncharacterized protein YdhG (YjbR/CyaY superfamily)
MRGNAVAPKDTDEYIALLPLPFRGTLEKLRILIQSVAPEAQEMISYQIPCFKYYYMLVGIGANKQYCSLYVMSPPLVAAMKAELKGVKVSGATIHFEPDAPLPVALIKKIVKARMQENKEKAMAKGK